MHRTDPVTVQYNLDYIVQIIKYSHCHWRTLQLSIYDTMIPFEIILCIFNDYHTCISLVQKKSQGF